MARKSAPIGRQRRALNRQIRAMATGPEHAALVEACRQIADTIDGVAGQTGAVIDDKLWREYRLALTMLQGAVINDGGGDATEDLIARLRAAVDDTEDVK